MSKHQQRVVINTRPTERAAPLSAALKANGYEELPLPLLALNPRPLTAHDKLLMQRWTESDYAVTVTVSPSAAVLGLKYWQSANDSAAIVKRPSKQNSLPTSFVAVGGATVDVFRRHGIAVQQPIEPNNEGMLEMPLIAALGIGDRVLMWRGLGGRRLLVETLRQRGVQVDSIAWYERVWPKKSSAVYRDWLTEHLQASTVTPWAIAPIVIISSGAAFEHWQHLLKPSTEASYPTLADFVYIVLGQRLAGLFADRQLRYQQVESLNPDEIIKAAVTL